ncbi:MAG: DUF1178 family protein [Planktotalea sp.]|uniref:DUF1178 family protein n=1 Tax=Planktotalea sp. TaxID=2029877 RepID=UPI003C758BBB
MIQYSLKCSKDHKFDSWFQSAAAFDKLQNAGLVTCAICGTVDVKKVLMAPAVRPARKSAAGKPQPNEPRPDEPRRGPLSAPASPAEQMVAEMRKQVEANSEYVGADFAKRARAMHDGDAPEKSIYGEAKIDEARKLLEDGVPVVPLPFRQSGKDN